MAFVLSRAPRAAALLAAVALATACTAGSDTGTATATSSAPTSPTAAPAPSTVAPSPTTTATAATTPLGGGPVLAVKIDNTSDARPRIGVDAADVVYVEPVEAGLTRLLAVFVSSKPAQVGPVRSARESDADLLGNYGRVAFAFSGGSGPTIASISKGTQINLSYDAGAGGFKRVSGRPAPYNLVGDPAALLARAGGSVAPSDIGFRFGAVAAGATSAPGSTVATAYPLARVSFSWDAASGRYLLTTDGTPDVTAAGTRVSAATVLVQTVRTHASANKDVNGIATPVLEVVGTGSAVVLRDGQSYRGTWSRPSVGAPTTLTSASGVPLTFAPGPVWVLLVPAGQSVSVS